MRDYNLIEFIRIFKENLNKNNVQQLNLLLEDYLFFSKEINKPNLLLSDILVTNNINFIQLVFEKNNIYELSPKDKIKILNDIEANKEVCFNDIIKIKTSMLREIKQESYNFLEKYKDKIEKNDEIMKFNEIPYNLIKIKEKFNLFVLFQL